MKNKYSKIISFENHKLGLYDVKTFVKDWENEPRRGVEEKRCKIVKKNGKKVLEKKLNLRKKKSYGINQVMFSLFFGGNDETFHTTKEEKVYFKKFVVQEN